MRAIMALGALTLSPSIAQEALDFEAAGINDVGSNETRELCIAMVGWALPEVGAVDGYYDEVPDILIHAHTLRAEGLNCFVTVDNVPYLIFVKMGGENMEGFVVQYSG